MFVIVWMNRCGLISDYMNLLRSLIDLIQDSITVCGSIKQLQTAHDQLYEFFLLNCSIETKEKDELKPLDYSMATLNLLHSNQKAPLDLSRNANNPLDVEKDRFLVIKLEDCKQAPLKPILKNARVRKYKKHLNKKSYPNVRFSL